MIDLLQAGLKYASRGWPVFPCDPATKRPLVKHGFKSATTDPATIRRWWKEWPAAMTGMPTGEPSGIVAIDIDVKRPFEADEIDGEKSWNNLLVDHAAAEPATRIIHTPSGGRHLYFRWRPGIGNSAGRLGRGIDSRGQGGYVVIPPSANAQGVAYELFHDHPVLSLPLWLASLLERDDD